MADKCTSKKSEQSQTGVCDVPVIGNLLPCRIGDDWVIWSLSNIGNSQNWIVIVDFESVYPTENTVVAGHLLSIFIQTINTIKSQSQQHLPIHLNSLDYQLAYDILLFNIYFIIILLSVKMNMRTFHKLSQQILNAYEDDKENQVFNFHQNQRAGNNGVQKAHVSKDQMINLKKMNAKKIQQMSLQNQKNMHNLQSKYQKQKADLIQKYEKIILEKEDYIKVLEELCSQKQQKIEPKFNKSIQNREVNQYKNRQIQKPNLYNVNQHNLYTHQAPLYSDLCFSIQRPLHLKKQKNGGVSEFCSSKKIKSRITSNEKYQKNQREKQNSVSSSKYRSQSSTRNSTSRHGLAPACPPKYCKVL